MAQKHSHLFYIEGIKKIIFNPVEITDDVVEFFAQTLLGGLGPRGKDSKAI